LEFELTVSPLSEADLPLILEIELESQPEPWSEKSFLEEIHRGNASLLGARVQAPAGAVAEPDEIAGFICFWSVDEEIQILNLAVRKTMRRMGIARKLIETAVRTGFEQHARFASLEVRKSNLAARRLYESFGFKIVGERRNYYGVQRESAILMQLDLASQKQGD